ncbi:hypothetical protein LTR49_022149 [Elasticomyces elasticus]|nr:hypothetical protein LTR49_022149 [Elasticomyces elasticus]
MCEGPPSRKRPNRDLANSGGGKVLNASTPHDEALSETKGAGGDNLQWPPTLRHADSGFASHKRELHSLYDSPSIVASPDTDGTDTGPGRLIHPLCNRRPYQLIAPVSERPEDEVRPLPNVTQDISPLAFTRTFRGYTSDGIDGSPVTTGSTEWVPVPCGGSGEPPITSFTMSRTSQAMHTAARHFRWRKSPEHLVKAAEALEERATPLRRLALRSPSHGINDHRVQQHASLPQQMSQPSNPSQVAFGTLPASESGMQYQFDLSTILRPDGTLKTGFTPTGGEVQTWDIDMKKLQLFEQPDLHFSVPTPQYDFQQQVHVPSTMSFGGSTHGSVSSVAKARRRGRRRTKLYQQ